MCYIYAVVVATKAIKRQSASCPWASLLRVRVICRSWHAHCMMLVVLLLLVIVLLLVWLLLLLWLLLLGALDQHPGSCTYHPLCRCCSCW